MIQRLADWIDDRTGYRQRVHEALYERIPSGARFRYVTGSMLVFAFVTQVITGIFLWMGYSPSSQTAYESVFFIQYMMTGGWLLRGIHHFMSQAMVVVMALHLLQVVWDGAYRRPREFNHWLGLVLLMLVLGLGLTGYLLPWDQKGYWATNVATNLATLVPGVGKEIQQLAVGGSAYGHHTLTRFFALHAGVLPILLVLVLWGHLTLFRRHGITAKVTAVRPDDYFWPRQILFDSIGSLVLLSIVLLLVIHFDVAGLVAGKLSPAHLGADLGPPANPSEQYSAARPEWYYLFLFQLLKYFPGPSEIIGAIVIPGAVMTIFFLMPFIGYFNIGHRFNQAFTVLILLAAVGLTGMALVDDYYALIPERLGLQDSRKLTASREFLAAREEAERDARRLRELISRRQTLPDGTLSDVRLIPRQGAVHLLRNDPFREGPRLFGQHCASCHTYVDPAEKSPWKFIRHSNSEAPDGAADLFGFATRAWIKGLLHHERIVSPAYFGDTNLKTGRMASWLKQNADVLKDDPDKPDDDVDAIAAALSAQARLPAQREADAKDADLIRRGIGLIEQHCARGCHKFGERGQLGLAPDLTAYGSYEWMLGLISDPAHDRFYRMENDRMPSFARDLDHPERNNVSVRELSLIVDWLREEYYRPEEKLPASPHDEDEAKQAVRLARIVESPHLAVIGAPPAQPETDHQKAERLFAANCALCHNHTDEHGRGVAAKDPSAPNLYRFGSREWLTGLLDPQRIATAQYFGNTRHAEADMVTFVNDDLSKLDDEGKAKLQSIIVALSAEAALPTQAELDKSAEADGTLEKGRQALTEAFETSSCIDCHKFRDEGDLGSAPDLTGWGSKEWLVRFISDPTHEAFYRDTNDRMPAFGKTGSGPRQSLLTAEEINLLASWLRGENLNSNP